MHHPLAGLLPEEISSLIDSEPPYRGRQIFSAIQNGARSFQEITTLSKPLRVRLENEFTLTSSSINQTLQDRDGTLKQQIQLQNGSLIETVLLTHRDGRKTACLSTQAGCAMGCTFCKTGQLKLERNLETWEIVEQFLHLNSALPQGKTISNIVFMGMGEPLENLNSVREAVAVFHHPEGKNVGSRRITISTCGIIRGIENFTEHGPDVRLAVSLNSADDQVRRSLMPISRTNPLPDLKQALLEYQKRRKKRITFEYVLLQGVNDRKEDISLLADYLKGLQGVINLIPYNPVEGTDFISPGKEDVGRFVSWLENAAIPVVQRYRRGRGIDGACGQLGVIRKESP